MALSHQKFREIVFQLLYSREMGGIADEAVMIDLIMQELSVSKKHVKAAQDKVQQILQSLHKIDPLIAKTSTSYDFERIQTVTKNVLRLGVFELFFDDQVPSKVAITEAMRLARKFGTPESATFVNALLDHLYQISQNTPPDLTQLEQSSQDLKQEEELPPPL